MVENSNSPTPGFGTVPSWERKKKRKNTPLSAVIVISLVFGGTAGGALGYLAADFSNGVSNTTSQVSDTSKPVAITPATETVSQIVQNVKPSVVSIKAEGSSGSGTGSGFIYREDGYIVTNNHVAAPAINGGKLTVYLEDKTSFVAKLVGRNASYDLAVLKIDVTSAPTLQLGNSDSILVGDTVIAIGSPLGLSGTVTSGIISAKNRAVTTGDRTGESSFINALQTDAAINPGNSGGPLIDIAGAVVGVNSAIATLGYGNSPGSIGLGFAIPINQAKKTVDQLIKTGSATYPIMGITVDTSFTGNGALISNQGAGITAGGPAAKAGLKAGDVITKLDGKSIDNSDELIVVIRSKNIGDKVKVEYSRNNVTREVVVTLAGSK